MTVTPMAWWHRLPGVCNHLASRVGGECGRPDDGTWMPLYPHPEAPVLDAIRDDATWLAELARDAHPSGEAARRVDEAATRVLRALGQPGQ